MTPYMTRQASKVRASIGAQLRPPSLLGRWNPNDPSISLRSLHFWEGQRGTHGRGGGKRQEARGKRQEEITTLGEEEDRDAGTPKIASRTKAPIASKPQRQYFQSLASRGASRAHEPPPWPAGPFVDSSPVRSSERQTENARIRTHVRAIALSEKRLPEASVAEEIQHKKYGGENTSVPTTQAKRCFSLSLVETTESKRYCSWENAFQGRLRRRRGPNIEPLPQTGAGCTYVKRM